MKVTRGHQRGKRYQENAYAEQSKVGVIDNSLGSILNQAVEIYRKTADLLIL